MTRYLVTAYSLQAARPTRERGRPARLPLQLDAAQIFARVSLPADIPVNAIVTKADLVWGIAEAYAGSVTYRRKRYATKMPTPIVWANKPAVTGSETTTVVTDPTTLTTFTQDAIADVQNWIAGTTPNYGWQLYITSGTLRYLDGVPAAKDAPYLDLEWVVPGEPPEDLSPVGRIGTGTPDLQFTVNAGTTHIQVQVDDDATFATPIIDSGMIAFGGDTVASYTPTSIGADGTTRYWRARSWSGGVPSEWSAVAEVIRDDLEAFTITTPGATTGDPAGEVVWTAIANQTAFQARLYEHSSGRYVANSGRVPGSATSWTPPSGLHGEGAATWDVELWDDKEDRVATTGVPVYSHATKDFAVNAGGADAGPTELNVTQRGGTPIIDLDITFAVAPAGGVQIIRTVDGGEPVWLDRIPYTGAHTMWADRTAPRFRNLTYAARAVTALGVVSAVGDTELIYPRSSGIWLLDPDADFADVAGAALLGKDQLSADMSEQAVLHAVTGRAPVRRRLGIPPPSGEWSRANYVLMDALGVTAEAAHQQLMEWKPRDAGTVYRLVFGTWNIPVTVGNIASFPTALSGDDPQYDAGFQWWQTDDELPWA